MSQTNYRALTFIESPTETTSAGLFDDSKGEQMQQQNPSGYSRNDRPAATSSYKNSTTFRPPYAYNDGSSNNNNNNSESYNRDAEDQRRTLSMIIFFLSFMVLYIGFCFYYQKKKGRARVMDGENENNGGEGTGAGLSRRDQLRENQIVLDESNNAARRARANAEAMVKYKQRKLDIEKALFIRLIVDEDEEDGGGSLEDMKNDDPRQDDLECAVAVASSTSVVGTDPIPPLFARSIVTIQEEDSDIEDDSPPMDGPEPMDRPEAQDGAPTIAATSLGDETENRSSADVNEGNTTSPLSPTVLDPPRVTTPSRSLTSDHPRLATSPSSSRPSPARSPSRRMTYADALNCANIHSRINACSNQYAKCGNSVSSSCHVGGNANRPGCTSKSDASDRTISHSEMFSRYDEECNICLTQFQVGDSAAWSMQYGMMVLPLAGSNSNMSCSGADTPDTNLGHFKNQGSASSTMEDVCKHVFHEECISRWLLVRDGCPICRRSYFPANMAVADTTPGNETDVEHGVNAGSVMENGMGRVEGRNAGGTTSLVVNMASE